MKVHQIFATCLFLVLCSTASRATGPDAGKQPSFSITVAVREDIILAPSELLLEITLTNTSDHDICCADGRDWRMFAIAVRDPKGNPVPRTPAWENVKHPYVLSSNVYFPIKPGGSQTFQVLLNRVFNLTRSGRYTVQATREDVPSGVTARSNSVAFTVPWPVTRRVAHPSFSVALSAPLESIRSGWQIPISIVVRNNSARSPLLAMWIEPDQGLDDFGAGFEVTTSDGRAAQLTNKGVAYRDRDKIPEGSFVLAPLPPGRTLEQIRRLGDLFDVSKPGQYTIQVALNDPLSGRVVKSNAVNVTVLARTDATALSHVEAPFIITLRTASVSAPGHIEFPLSICRTNISDRDIVLDNFTYMDEMRVVDSHGSPVALTAAGNNPQSYAAVMKKRPDDAPEPWRQFKLSPAQTECGVLGLEQIWDMEKPGIYSIEVIQRDYPDRAPGQKLEEMPIVRSNKVEIRVSP